ncbi:hypothetical protein DLM78_09410 [Leptospira stimsonii]|uniref:Uncharacterized protein n=1 Tax=Leptospira stimsonii TaxID=2202203 RepID=A0A8B3CPZ4_9LEPT|nr:hypothetical protein DLM78_09410 [Leptospira stimsonii]
MWIRNLLFGLQRREESQRPSRNPIEESDLFPESKRFPFFKKKGLKRNPNDLPGSTKFNKL